MDQRGNKIINENKWHRIKRMEDSNLSFDDEETNDIATNSICTEKKK